jgi:HK97 family phage portal protein
MQNKLSFRQKLGLTIMGLKAQGNSMPALLLPNQYYSPVWKDWNTSTAITEGFKACVYVYAGIYRIMKSAASVPWVAKDPTEDDIIPKHPLELLMRRPNSFMSGQDLIERLTSHLYLGGNGVLYKNKVRRDGRDITAELWPLQPDYITPVPDQMNYIKSYKYQTGAISKELDPSNIIHIMFIDPGNLYWGMSPIQAAARIIDTDVEATKWNKISLQNRAITDGVFSFDHTITKKQWTEAREMVREQHQGSDNARMPWILGSGARWNQMSLSPVDMDFIEGKKMTREDICAVLNMPPPMVSIYDNATLANIETARKIMWLDTIIPYLDDLKSAFDLALVREFGDDIILDYDTRNVQALQEDFHKRVETGYKLWTMGVPFDIINRKLKLGIDDVPSGNVGYVQANLIPTGYAGLESLTQAIEGNNGGNGEKTNDLTLEELEKYFKLDDIYIKKNSVKRLSQ